MKYIYILHNCTNVKFSLLILDMRENLPLGIVISLFYEIAFHR